MAYNVQNVADLARSRLNDDAKKRASDAKLEFWFNQGMNVLALMRPDLFTIQDWLVPAAAQSFQNLATADSDVLALYNIVATKPTAGSAASTITPVYEVSFYPLLASKPTTFADTAGVPQQWARQPGQKGPQSATRYFLDPAPVSGTVLLVQYAKPAPYLALADVVPLSVAYREPLANYLVHCYESVDDDYIVAGRAALELSKFVNAITAGAQSKQVGADQ